ncbi:MAG: hypothetical protein JO233_07925, partial [Candidatus Eremiobacteraeota bacterium]|nr:hypothetical protein [Candidatus Eremiobacteraeota bacterium]
MTAATGIATQYALYAGLGAGVLAILYGIYLIAWILRRPAGNERMQDIA